MNWLLDSAKARLKEKSTWAGIATLIINIAIGFGVTITPELKEQILIAVNSIAGVALVMTKAQA